MPQVPRSALVHRPANRSPYRLIFTDKAVEQHWNRDECGQRERQPQQQDGEEFFHHIPNPTNTLAAAGAAVLSVMAIVRHAAITAVFVLAPSVAATTPASAVMLSSDNRAA